MKYIDADRLREELQKSKTELKVGNYYLDNSEQAVGYENALIDFESLLDTLEEPDKDLEEEISTWIPAHIKGGDGVWKDAKNAIIEWAGIVARHFYEFGKGIK